MKRTFTKTVSLLLIAVFCFCLYSCDNTVYTLEKVKEMPDIHKGFFGEDHSSFYPDLTQYISTNAPDVVYSAESSDKEVATVEINKEKLTVTVLRRKGESVITVTASSKKANKSIEFKFKVTAELYARVE